MSKHKCSDTGTWVDGVVSLTDHELDELETLQPREAKKYVRNCVLADVAKNLNSSKPFSERFSEAMRWNQPFLTYCAGCLELHMFISPETRKVLMMGRKARK